METTLIATLYFVLTLIATVVLFALAAFGWTQRRSRIGLPFMLVTFSAALIPMMTLLTLLVDSLPVAYGLARLQAIAATLAAVHFLAFSMAYVGLSAWHNRYHLTGIYGIVAVNALVIWTDPLHSLYFRSFAIREIGGYTFTDFSQGVWFYVAMVVFSAMIFISAALLLQKSLTSTGAVKRQVYWVLLGVLTPFLTILAVIIGRQFGIVPTYHPYSLSFAITGMIFLRVVVRNRLLYLTPVALSLIFDELPEAIIVVDNENRVTDINAAARALRSQPESAIIGEPYDLVWPELADMPPDHEITFQFTDAPSRHFEYRQKALYADAEPLGKMLILQDITERVQTLDAIANSEQRYRQIFNTNRAIKLVIDPDTGRIVDANEAAIHFYGYAYETLLSMTIHEINILDEAQINYEMRCAEAERRNYFEFKHRLANGDIRDVDVFSSPIDMPEGRMLYSIILDVTGKREAELRYRSLFNQSNDAVFILDLQGRHLAANRRASELLGYTPQEITGLSFRELILPEEHPRSEDVIGRLLAGEHLAPYERKFLCKDGTIFTGEINAEIVHDTTGDPLHIQSVVRDITERQQMEQQRFEIALEKERINLLMKFIQNAAHEFRTPLAVINTSVHLLTRTEDASRRATRGLMVQEQVKRISRLVDMLLLMVRLESDPGAQRQPVDMRAVVQATCHVIQLQEGDQPRLVVDASTPVPPVMGIVNELDKALHHVLENAYQHTPPEGEIHVSVYPDAGSVYITIRDNGIGIMPEAQRHIFEMFWRGDAAHTTPGFGLGLSIVQKIIERHEGEIIVESIAGEGTTFTIRLPIHVEIAMTKKTS